MTLAQESTEDQWKQDNNKGQKFWKVRELKKTTAHEKQKKIKNRIEKEQLCKKLEAYGSLWKIREEVQEKLSTLEASERMAVLKAQIQWRKKVVGATNPNEKLFQMSSGGKLYAIQEVSSNLIEIIAYSD